MVRSDADQRRETGKGFSGLIFTGPFSMRCRTTWGSTEVSHEEGGTVDGPFMWFP